MDARPKKKWGQYAALILFLVIFPLISYIYLKKGFDYRLEAMQELLSLGSFPFEEGLTLEGDTLTLAELRGNLTIAHFLDLDAAEAPAVGGKLAEIHEQFGGLQKVRFLLQVDSADVEAAPDYFRRHHLWQQERVFLIPAAMDYPGYYRGYFIPEEKQTPFTVSLVDTAGTVRFHYDLQDGNQMRRLVEHLTYIMPPEDPEPTYFRPEQDL